MIKGRKKRFSTNQTVVFRFAGRNLVGKIHAVNPVGKTTNYDVLGEDGKVYTEIGVDVASSYTIDTHLTKLFYSKYNLDESGIPDHTPGIVKVDKSPLLKVKEEDTEYPDSNYDSEGHLYEIDAAELS
jgi:hypothetical protein